MAIEVHLEKRIHNRHVVREADNTYRREYLAITLLLGAILVCLLFYGWQHYRWIQYGYRIEAAQKMKAELVEVNEQLRLERASLRNIRRIDDIARRQLGMIDPAPGQLVVFSADSPLQIPVAAPGSEEQMAARR